MRLSESRQRCRRLRLLIEVGKGEASPSWALEVREGLDRTKGAPTAPAEGLYFWDVRYPEAFNLPSGRSIIIPGLN